MNDLFLKAVILTILAIGLANTSVYNAGAEPFTPTVIPGNLPEIIKQEGIPPVTTTVGGRHAYGSKSSHLGMVVL